MQEAITIQDLQSDMGSRQLSTRECAILDAG
jgi:hypothetical protein